jgi:hypothetical protein
MIEKDEQFALVLQETFLIGTDPKKRAIFDREGGATWGNGRGWDRVARTAIAVQREVVFARSGEKVGMWHDVVDTGVCRSANEFDHDRKRQLGHRRNVSLARVLSAAG